MLLTIGKHGEKLLKDKYCLIGFEDKFLLQDIATISRYCVFIIDNSVKKIFTFWHLENVNFRNEPFLTLEMRVFALQKAGPFSFPHT